MSYPPTNIFTVIKIKKKQISSHHTIKELEASAADTTLITKINIKYSHRLAQVGMMGGNIIIHLSPSL